MKEYYQTIEQFIKAFEKDKKEENLFNYLYKETTDIQIKKDSLF